MATFRSTIPDFQLANPIYTGATASFFAVDAEGVITATLATLYAEPTGTQTVSNPQTLDSEGKFVAPVYIAGPVIGEVVGANVASHNTGVINARGTWRGDYDATVDAYYTTDFVVDPVSGNVYAAAADFAPVSLAADIAAGSLVLVIDQTNVVSGGASLAIKRPARLATTANITLSGLQTIDGVLTVAGDRILVKDQSVASANGLYNAAAGAWSRTVDADHSAEIGLGMIVFVTSGTLSHNKGYQASIATPFTLGTDAFTWAALEMPNSAIVVQIGAAADSVVTTGVKGYHTVPFNCTISSSLLVGDAAGSIIIDIKKSTVATFPPTASICASAKPTLSAAQIAQDLTLTGWTVALSQGDVLAFEVVSVSGIKFATLTLPVNRN